MRNSILALALVGCGGGGSLTSFEGVYTVDTWTENLTSCGAEGSSTLSGQEPVFYVKAEDFLGSKFVNVVSCPDVATCQTKARDNGTLNLGGFEFESGNDVDGWTDHGAFGFVTNGSCMGDVHDTVLTSPAMGKLRIERRQTDAAPFAPSGGECSDAATEAAAAGQPCTDFEVVTATLTTSF